MKTLLLLSLLGFFTYPAQAATLPTHFATESTVYYIGQPETTVQLILFEKSEDSWSYLRVLSGDPKNFLQQEEAIRRAYPHLEAVRVISRGMGRATITIGALGLSKYVAWVPYRNGPGFEASFELTQAQTQKAIASQDLRLSISGKVKAYVKGMNVIESTTIPGTAYCDGLLRNGNTIERVFLSYPAVAKKIDSLTTRFPETKQSLKKSLLRECLEVPASERLAGTFKDLLEVKVSNANPEVIVGETRQETPTLKEADFSTEIPKTVTSTVGG